MFTPYLGFSVHRDGHKASTIKLRTAMARGKATTINSLVEHPAIVHFGWLKVSVQSNNPKCLDSCESWLRVTDRAYHSWPKSKTKVVLFYKTGSLRFRSVWRANNTKNGTGTSCAAPMYPEEDNMEHMKVCPFYFTKWNDKRCMDSELGDFLVNINRERRSRFR